ncbi:hypothetical protein NQZ68_019378 [Dissostichus eleginoides]|nr:hypothetical protein NQZ68_019378 [Dissostichus eleginoides]
MGTFENFSGMDVVCRLSASQPQLSLSPSVQLQLSSNPAETGDFTIQYVQARLPGPPLLTVCTCQLRSAYVHVTAAQDVFPVLFMLDWLAYQEPQSGHMIVSASHRGACDRAAQMRRHAAFCLPVCLS